MEFCYNLFIFCHIFRNWSSIIWKCSIQIQENFLVLTHSENFRFLSGTLFTLLSEVFLYFANSSVWFWRRNQTSGLPFLDDLETPQTTEWTRFLTGIKIFLSEWVPTIFLDLNWELSYYWLYWIMLMNLFEFFLNAIWSFQLSAVAAGNKTYLCCRAFLASLRLLALDSGSTLFNSFTIWLPSISSCWEKGEGMQSINQ